MKIKTKILIMTGLVVFMTLGLGFMNYFLIKRVESSLYQITEDSVPSLLQVSEIEIDYYALRLSVFRSINASGDQSKLLSQPILNNMQNLRSSFSDYRKYFTNEEDKRLYALIDNSLKEYLVAVKKTQHMLERGEFHNSPEKDKMIKLGARLAEDLRISMLNLKKFNVKNAALYKKQADDSMKNLMIISISLSFLMIFILLIVSFSIVKSVNHSIRNIVTAMQQIRLNSDLAFRIPHAEDNSEMAVIAKEVNVFLEGLHYSFLNIRKTAFNLEAIAKEVLKTSSVVSHAVHSQSDSTSTISSSVEQVSTSISLITDQASEAKQLADRVEIESSEGSYIIDTTQNRMLSMLKTIEDTASDMENLEASSKKISDVVAVIQDVAQQTNLLALNAAIEAARAGEQGRGFAVVADEVRALAERTSASSAAIEIMIKEILTKTNQAVSAMKIVVDCAISNKENMIDVSSAILKIKECAISNKKLIDSVSLGLGEQNTATQVIAASIENIALQSQQTGAVVNKFDLVASSLSEMSSQTIEQISRYKI